MIFPGFHFYFISDDKKLAGHVLEISIKDAIVEIDKLNSIKVRLFN
ncbi:hypothetical protein DID80_01185 [Candidatus Marinamargulisbacteria bacterium SCGC AAA071-K20]|nr:hypothetical protein DID80_01185 [Candidatus Marinamargulisbacteria bacterium SCGC AAA071-K20]